MRYATPYFSAPVCITAGAKAYWKVEQFFISLFLKENEYE